MDVITDRKKSNLLTSRIIRNKINIKTVERLQLRKSSKTEINQKGKNSRLSTAAVGKVKAAHVDYITLHNQSSKMALNVGKLLFWVKLSLSKREIVLSYIKDAEQKMQYILVLCLCRQKKMSLKGNAQKKVEFSSIKLFFLYTI